MKLLYTHLLALAVFGVLVHSGLGAQLCTVNSTDTVAIVLPSDTIEIDGSVIGSQVLQFVLPGDTTFFGYHVIFDSLDVYNIAGLQNGMQVECHTSNPLCIAYGDSTGFLRFCLRVGNTQVLGYSPSYPNYRVMQVVTRQHVILPFPTYNYLKDTLDIWYRVHNADSILPVGVSLMQASSVVLHPNPVSGATHLDYQLAAPLTVVVTVTDALGRRLFVTPDEIQQAGHQSLTLSMDGWPAGAYFVNLQAGQQRHSRKLIKIQ
jgi:hypothetical protein